MTGKKRLLALLAALLCGALLAVALCWLGVRVVRQRALADALGRARLWDVSDALSTFPPDGSGWPGGFTYGPGQFAYVYTDESGRQVQVQFDYLHGVHAEYEDGDLARLHVRCGQDGKFPAYQDYTVR